MRTLTNDQLWTLWEFYTVMENPVPVDLQAEMGERGLMVQ